MADAVPARCGACVYWDRVEPDARMLSALGPDELGEAIVEGICRANPPQTYPITLDGKPGALSVWTRTYANEKCGVFEPAEEAP